MNGLEEENAKLRSSLKAGLAELASIDPEEQVQILEIARHTGQQLPDPALLKEFAREEDLTLPLFRHAQSIDQPGKGTRLQNPTKRVGEAPSSATAAVGSPQAAAVADAANANANANANATSGGAAEMDPTADAASNR
jgi:hypothetical protein